ncbi:putative porin [Microbulbifer sp. CnH-101-G]|uniref:putative porin n=1 Tax=Microbulbifer sp. CnH-101-G TaxID=3243393 RepID=UPI00403A0309
MKSLRMSIFPLMVLATGVTAEEYKSITTLSYSDKEYSYHDHYYSPMGWPYSPTSGYSVEENKYKTSSVGTTYFFGGKETLGPLKEFEYINKISNISAQFSRHEIRDDYWRDDHHQNSLSTKGEYFLENGVVLSAGIEDKKYANIYDQSIGYFFTPNVLVKLNYSNTDFKYFDEEEEFSLTAQYSHQLSDAGYIGFTMNVGEEADDHTLSSKYFVDFGNDKYLSVEASYYHGNGRVWGDASELSAEFYFNKETSVNIAYDENHRYKLGFSHFFNRNIAFDVVYLAAATNKYNGYYEDYGCDDCDAYRYDEYRLGLRVQL